MYQCPSCGGELKFDIASQQLKCTFCQQLVQPSAFHEVSGAEESDTFQATRFVCPQCGAAIISADNTAAAFCSFCGASTVLESRVSNQKRPQKILPFQKTKKDCVRIYHSLMRRAFFVPSSLKSDECIESFRGIYMPYWVYDVTYSDSFHLNGSRSHQDGDYTVTEHYDLTGTIDAEYHGFTHDASKDFADDISESIAPYDTRKACDFNASYLSGFYADMADIRGGSYYSDAFDITDKLAKQEILKCRTFKKYHPTEKSTSLPHAAGSPRYALFPVWFMSYRYGERVGYVTINGQTGRAAADLPIDIFKYAIGALILALPLFLFLNPILFMSAKKTLGLAAVFSLVTMLIAHWEQNKLGTTKSKARSKKKTPKHSAQDVAFMFLFAIVWFSILHEFLIYLVPIVLVLAGISYLSKNKDSLRNPLRQKGSGLCLGAALVGLAILLLAPVSDYWYYGGTLVCAAAVFMAFREIIANYNLLTTRPLPQFSRKGGDDRVEK